MIIKNLTNVQVPLKSFIRTVNGIVEMTLKISPRGETYIEEESTYPDLMRLYEEGVLAINGKTHKDSMKVVEAEVADSTPAEDVTTESETTADSVETPEETSEDASGFTCPHCSAEFASNRGLAMHLKKSHPEVSE